MTWRLCLHYGPDFQIITGQSPVDIDSQAEPGNQENDNFRSTILVFLGLLRQPLNRWATFRRSYGTLTAPKLMPLQAPHCRFVIILYVGFQPGSRQPVIGRPASEQETER